MQKKRWPFFFFDADFESPFTLSSSEPSRPSSSAPPISTSCDSADWDERCESSRARGCREGVAVSSRAGVSGEVGRGRWPARPPKLLRVGVFAEGSSVRASSAGLLSLKKVLFGRGVVGVVSSPGRPGRGSGTGSAVLTALKTDMPCTACACVYTGAVERQCAAMGSWCRKTRCASRPSDVLPSVGGERGKTVQGHSSAAYKELVGERRSIAGWHQALRRAVDGRVAWEEAGNEADDESRTPHLQRAGPGLQAETGRNEATVVLFAVSKGTAAEGAATGGW